MFTDSWTTDARLITISPEPFGWEIKMTVYDFATNDSTVDSCYLEVEGTF